jgi:hypothetical protein
MIIIEFLFTLVLLGLAWFAGFWCGKTYGTLNGMVERIKKVWDNKPPTS